MGMLGYICHPDYKCRCGKGKLVSRETAMRHRAVAHNRIDGNEHDEDIFLPLPSAITSSLQLSSLYAHASEVDENDIENGEAYSSNSTQSNSTVSITLSTRSESENSLCLIPVAERVIDHVQITANEVSSDSLGSNRHVMCLDRKFALFMEKHANVLGLGIKHSADDAFMTDLIKDISVSDSSQRPYKSFSGVRKALLRNSGLCTTEHPACTKFHKALDKTSDGSVLECSYCNDNFSTAAGLFEYIPVWERIEMLLQSPVEGPLLCSYFWRGVLEKEEGVYSDFFSGRIFQDIVSQRGGLEMVKYDIFLALSADGVQPFKLDNYTYWIALCVILNLPPSIRFKARRLLPLLLIPGPNEPKDLTSFLRPFITEIQSLSLYGRNAKLWNGERRIVRVHLLFALADLPAMKKLTHLKGPNGLVPCRFCLIRGIHVHHCYFPPVFSGHDQSNAKRRIVDRVLWDPSCLPLRTHSEVMEAYNWFKEMEFKIPKRELEYHLKQNGFSSTHPTPLLELNTMRAFRSFPIDIMHLLFENVAKDVVSIWCNDSGRHVELAYLSSRKVYEAVNDNLRACRKGFGSYYCRAPRGLDKRGLWKASEWKLFTTSTSLVVLDGWVPAQVLSGWKYFVQLVRLTCQWRHSEEDVDQIGSLAERFYRHFVDLYYKKTPDRVHLCKYVYHLLLHLAQNIRDCGPISLLGQWTTENFVGYVNRITHAKHLFAQSAREKIKYHVAASLYSLRYGIQIPHIEETDVNNNWISPLTSISSPSSTESGQTQFSLLGPSCHTSITNEGKTNIPGLRDLLVRYYISKLGISRAEAGNLVRKNDSIRVWGRLRDSKTMILRPWTYHGFSQYSEHRSTCYFSGMFACNRSNEVDVYYGKTFCFLSHEVCTASHELVVADWATRGLRRGNQGQVYSRSRIDSDYLFACRTVEEVEVISHPIAVVQTTYPCVGKRHSVRTYFVDEMQDTDGVMTYLDSNKDVVRCSLKGIEV
ncbi:hypothetical protein BWQ96_10587 [Gracilariopsis chorda]|uniref:Uncharacterized protein n=1 Tax=Gracilariopsis chorda TaxID=448386 RepID=A0A2V3ICB6_9FLOR|nr:hypothetical protein BWQ96_10587 [Gracilariopsis chorda]|eukprot:PXF39711.1 hypothetical protein BWQ96_10587 [Gracilariopsis chorda]